MTWGEYLYGEEATSARLERLVERTGRSKEEIIAASLIFYEDVLNAFDEGKNRYSSFEIVGDPYEIEQLKRELMEE